MKTQNSNRNLTIAGIIILALVVLLSVRECQFSRDFSTESNIQLALKDSLKIIRNSQGQSVGKTTVIEVDNSEQLLSLASKDKTILKLQTLVAKYKKELKKPGNVAIVATTEAVVDISVSKSIQIIDDKGNISYEPVPFNLKDWVWGTVTTKKDSVNISLKYKEEINFVLGQEKTGFLGLGKTKTFAEITFKNPYNEVKDMKVYQVKEKSKNYWHIGPNISYGISSQGKRDIFAGIGIMWTPINF
jgi:hypothetical protein